MSTEREGAAERFVVTPFFESRGPTLEVPVEQIMTRRVFTARPTDTTYDAARTLLAANIAALPVVEDEKVVGILSLSDLLYRLKTPHGTIADALLEWFGGGRPELRKHLAHQVAGVMTSPVVTVEATDNVAAAATRMLEHKVHQLPVLDRGKLVGMISRRDVIGALAAWAEEGAGLTRG